jgi:4-aminobutyrate aminotransferase-like enzyme
VNRGFVVGRRPGINVLRLDPSLTIERQDVEGFMRTFEDVLTDRTGGA